jgi:hypothetical protein
MLPAPGESVVERLTQGLQEPVLEREGEGSVEEERDCRMLALPPAAPALLALALPLGVSGAEAAAAMLWQAEKAGEGVVPLTARPCASHPGLCVGLCVRVSVREAVAVSVAGEAEGEGVLAPLPLPLPVALGEALGEGVALGEALARGEAVASVLALALELSLREREGEAVAEGVRVPRGEGEKVGESGGERLALAQALVLRVRVGLAE